LVKVIKDKRVFLPALIAILSVIVFVLAIKHHQTICPICVHLKAFSPDVIKHFVQGFGPWAIVVFIALYALNTISLLPPIGIMSLTAGFIFGPVWGSVAIMFGTFLGTSSTFFISRYFAGPFVQNIIKGKGKEFQDKLDKNGFKVILFIRLIPLLPWEIVNYAAGLSKIKYRDYILATLIGVFPAVVVQTYFSDRLSNFNIKDPTVIAAIGAFILLGAIPALYLKYKNKKTTI
jgi:uncharacterized membrane protein YdjX (TVP38/TMEM64 family)